MVNVRHSAEDEIRSVLSSMPHIAQGASANCLGEGREGREWREGRKGRDSFSSGPGRTCHVGFGNPQEGAHSQLVAYLDMQWLVGGGDRGRRVG